MSYPPPPPRALSWLGGKSAHASARTGRWINSLLPPAWAAYTYVEPFAGMLGILLQRPPARREIVNDLDGDIINWWRVVRDHCEELGRLLDFSPAWSVDLYEETVRNLSHPDPVRRAYYFTLALCWTRANIISLTRTAARNAAEGSPSFASSLRRRRTGKHDPGSPALLAADSLAGKKGPGPLKRPIAHRPSGEEMAPPRSGDIRKLRDRIARVELENRDAYEMVSFYSENPNLIMYLDPPYPSAAPQGEFYIHNSIDTEAWVPLLLKVEGLCAISGYGTEWDALRTEGGWIRSEHPTHSIAGRARGVPATERTEVLWTNYRPGDFQAQPSLLP